MSRVFVIVLLLVTQGVFCQSAFSFNENGLTPKETDFFVGDQNTKDVLYKKTLKWFQEEYGNSKNVVSEQVENEYVVITLIKPNYINVKKDYYYVKYSMKISFAFGQCTFEPIEVFTKLNSKYDMGWQAFDLSDGTAFFKRGKPIKKTKVYVEKIPALFNELNESLFKELNSK